MSEIQIKTQIEKLQNLASNWIDSKELDEAKSILEVIKSEKASKTQLEEIIKLLQDQTAKNSDYVVITKLSSYQKDFEKLLSNYSEEKQVIVDETVANKSEVIKDQNKVNENSDSQKRYNEKHIETYSQRINTVLEKLDENDKTQKEIKEALGNTLISSSDIRVRNLQDLLISSWAKIKSDWFFWPKTMKALEKIVGIKTVDAPKKNHKSEHTPAKNTLEKHPKTTNPTTTLKTEPKTKEIKHEIAQNIKTSDGSIMSWDFIKNDKWLRTLYNGTIKYPDGKVDIYENWKKKNYMIQYMALMWAMVAVDLAWFTWIWTAPSLVIWTAYDGYNIKEFLSWNEDAWWQILKKSWFVDPRFNNWKQSYLEWALSVLWLVPWMTAATKWYKIAKFAKTLKPEELAEFNKMESFFKDRFFWIWETAAKKWQIWLEHSKEANDLRKAREKEIKKAAKEKKVTAKNVETKSSEKIVEIRHWRYTIKMAKELEESRGANLENWLPTWIYSKYASKYENLYKELDAKWITEVNWKWIERRKEIKKLDREIAKDLLKSKIPETISDEIFDAFTKTWEIPKDILESIANKIKNWEEISARELSIQQTFGKEIETILQKLAKWEKTTESTVKSTANEWTKATEETINTEARASEEILDNAWNISKFAKGKFTDLFKKELKENQSITIWENTYKKRADWKFEIEWDDILYSEKQILDKIKDEDKIVFLQSRAKQNIANLWEKTIKLKDWFFDFLWKYKVSEKEVLVKENGTWRKITNETELNKFYSDNFEELLKQTKWIDIKKIAEDTSKSFLSKFDWSKWSDALKAFDKWAEQAFLLKYWYKPWRWITKTALHEIATPYNILKGIKDAKWFWETVKSIIFADKDMWIVKWTLKVWAYAIVPAAWEVIRKTNNWEPINLNWKDVIEDYLEFMYLWIINGLIIEYVERKINKPENETKN